MHDGLWGSEMVSRIQSQPGIKPASWMSQIEFINHLILFNNMIITVLAEQYGGKTTLASLMLEHLDEQIKPMLITARAPCNREQIIDEIATRFHLKNDEHTDISSLVAQINERRSHVLLIIDDAQHLPEVFIKEVLLAIKNQECFNYFHICLFADYSLVGTLNGFAASFFKGLIHILDLGKLTASEALDYTKIRAKQLRLDAIVPSEKQLKQFYQTTDGSIARINTLIESFLLNTTSTSKEPLINTIKKIAIPIGSALGAGLICLFFVKNLINESSIPETTLEHEVAVKTESTPSFIAHWQLQATHEIIEHKLAINQNLDNPLENKTVIAEATRAQVKEELNRPQTSPIEEEKRYTVQLVASPDKRDMERYLKSNKLLYANARLSHYLEKNKEVWYVLTIGEFSNMSEAQQSIARLPPPLRKLNPWVRPISSLG